MAGGTLTPDITVAPALAYLKLGREQRCEEVCQDCRGQEGGCAPPGQACTEPRMGPEQGWPTVVRWSWPRGPSRGVRLRPTPRSETSR